MPDYTSNESGRTEVFVQPFPPTGSKWQITTEGAGGPVWRSDGAELFSVRLDGMLAGADVITRGTAFTTGSTRTLFRVGGPPGPADERYEVARDGPSSSLFPPTLVGRAAEPGAELARKARKVVDNG